MKGPDDGVNEQKVLVALDTAWSKFGKFAAESMVQMKFPDIQVTEAREFLSYDVMIFLPKIRSFLTLHAKALADKDVQYFRDIAPPKVAYLKDLEIPQEISDKVFLFARVFTSLLNDLSKAQ